MNGKQILKERISRNWEQRDATNKLKVSQPYLSLIEAGKRPVTEKLARRAVRVFNLPTTALPVKHRLKTSRSKTRLFALDPYDIALAKIGRNIDRDC